MPGPRTTPSLDGSCVISLRPVGEHEVMRRVAARHGARVLALSPWRIEHRDDDVAREALRAALACDVALFTSPNAVRAAAAVGMRQRRDATWLAVGAGTAAALRRAGARTVIAPSRMDSEGVLALPALRDVRGHDIGLVTAPGGRGVIAATLARRGACVLRANVYERIAIPPSSRAIDALQSLRARPWLALSSGEALQHVLETLPAGALRVLVSARVLAASERLAGLARDRGFADVRVATDARPRALLEAAFRPG